MILDPMFLIQVFVFPKIEEVNLPDSEILCPELLHLELLYQEPLYSELPDPVNLDSVFLYLVFQCLVFPDNCRKDVHRFRRLPDSGKWLRRRYNSLR